MWEYITGAIIAPLQTFRAAAASRLWKQGLLLVAGIGLIKGAANVVITRSNPTLFSELATQEIPLLEEVRSLMQSPSFSLSNAVLGGLLFWFLAGVICYGLSKLFKGEGAIGGLLASFAFASSPSLIGSPLTALVSLLGGTGLVLGNIISFGTGLWVFILEILAVRESMRTSTGAAIIALLIGFIGYLIALILVGLFIAIITILAAGV